MSRKILSVLLAVFLAVGIASFTTKADVTGSFTAKIVITPIECGAFPFITFPVGTVGPVVCEDTFPKSDVETSLSVNWTISGLTLGTNVVAGFTGLEHVLLSFKATLGALNVTDQFFFAVPFGTDLITISSQLQRHEQINWTVINGDATHLGHLLFVKKRVTASISLAGITLTNFAELADATFPRDLAFGPAGLPCAELQLDGRCPFLPAQTSFDPVLGYTEASQTFRFGDTLTVEGQTVSGITLRNITGIGMDPQAYEGFKKISFPGVVCNNEKLGFAVEKIQVEGIPIGPITASEFFEFRMRHSGDPDCDGLVPFQVETDLSFASPLGNIDAILITQDITQQALVGATLTISSGGVTILQELTATLAPLLTRVTLSATLNADSNPASLRVQLTVCQNAPGVGLITGFSCTATGLRRIDTTLSVKRSNLTFSVFSRLGGGPPVALQRLRFTLTAVSGAVNLGATIQLPVGTDKWLGIFTAGVNF